MVKLESERPKCVVDPLKIEIHLLLGVLNLFVILVTDNTKDPLMYKWTQEATFDIYATWLE